MIKILLVAGAALLAAACMLKSRGDEAPDIEAQPPADAAAEAEEAGGTETVRATLRSVKHDMNPVTLQGWTRIVCDCGDGVVRKMSFDGETGVYLAAGESGLLEHHDGVFVSFTKDSGEVVAKLYRMLPEDGQEETEG